MNQTAQIVVAGESYPFKLDFDEHIWTADRDFQEGDFPLIAEVDGGRYELYSNGTFSEEEL